MSEISATEAARNLSQVLDALEHRGERFTIVRRGRAIARLEPLHAGRGDHAKDLLGAHQPDAGWADELAETRDLAPLRHRR